MKPHYLAFFLWILWTNIYTADLTAASTATETSEEKSFAILLREVWRQEFQIFIENQQLRTHATQKSKELAWLAGVLVDQFKLPTEFNLQEKKAIARQFDINQKSVSRIQKMDFQELQSYYWKLLTVEDSEKGLDRVIITDPSIQLDCPNSITKKSLTQNISACEGVKKALIVLFGGEDKRFRVWLETVENSANDASLIYLRAWLAIRSKEYAQALDLLFPLTKSKIKHARTAYEATQRIYSFTEKGRGSVAIKRL